MCLLLLSHTRDFHPLVYAHAGRTNNKSKNIAALAFKEYNSVVI